MANKKDIKGLICKVCRKTFLPPIFTCDQCGSESFSEAVFSGEGEVITFTKVLRAEPGEKVPYVLAGVQLKNGARILTRIQNFEDKEPAIGKKVVATGDYYRETPLFEIV